MNNPFLSDRPIFSKVVNPTKKKETGSNKPAVAETFNKQNHLLKKEAGPYQPKYEGPIASNSKGPLDYNKDRLDYNPPAPKMTFGKPNEADNATEFDSQHYKSTGMNFGKEQPR